AEHARVPSPIKGNRSPGRAHHQWQGGAGRPGRRVLSKADRARRARRADGVPPAIHQGYASRQGLPGRGHAGRDAADPRRDTNQMTYRLVVTARARNDAVEAFRWMLWLWAGNQGAMAVLAGWGLLLATGRYHSVRLDPIDRVGRWIGGCWLVGALA